MMRDLWWLSGLDVPYLATDLPPALCAPAQPPTPAAANAPAQPPTPAAATAPSTPGASHVLRLQGLMLDYRPWWTDAPVVNTPALVREMDGIASREGKVHLVISSPGGLAAMGALVHDALVGYARDGIATTTEIQGLAGSAAGIAFLGADERVIGAASLWHAHRAWAAAGVRGDADQIERASTQIARQLRAVDATLMQTISRRATLSLESLAEGVWMGADAAIAAGIATRAAAPAKAPAPAPAPGAPAAPAPPDPAASNELDEATQAQLRAIHARYLTTST